MALMLCDSEFIDQATGQCLRWVEYVPLIPDLSKEQTLTIWFWFLFSLLCAWGAKNL